MQHTTKFNVWYCSNEIKVAEFHTRQLASCWRREMKSEVLNTAYHFLIKTGIVKIKLSHAMRKPVHVICEQLRRRSACATAQSDQRLWFRYLDSKIPLVSISEISRLLLVSAAAQAGLSLICTNSPRPIFKWRGSILMRQQIWQRKKELSRYHGCLSCLLTKTKQNKKKKKKKNWNFSKDWETGLWSAATSRQISTSRDSSVKLYRKHLGRTTFQRISTALELVKIFVRNGKWHLKRKMSARNMLRPSENQIHWDRTRYPWENRFSAWCNQIFAPQQDFLRDWCARADHVQITY